MNRSRVLVRPRPLTLLIATLVAVALSAAPLPAAGPAAATPEELVATYESLADTILASKAAEKALVISIVSMTYRHAEGTVARARATLASGGDARAEIEALAALVSQIGNEGDAAVAATRKRLLEGGHHHNAAGEQQGIYDEGYVIVTRAAKKAFLDQAARIGRLAGKPDAASLDAIWKDVSAQYASLMKEARG